ncbi:MAG: 1,4-dihydroxy-6-naphthoate synthase [Sphingobacteriales bacterium 12-47-4]|nr:MAG: 1,4-dihydroxy-6-naphthoate synthase [Sphingobacteriales bacterium 12-47-4]
MKLTLGFSPCPNDTFIFDALINKIIPSDNLELSPVLEDVETLNQWAFEGKLDITKLSFATAFQVADQYRLLNSGAALGKGVGPLLVSKKPIAPDQVPKCRIAIPGIHTTANLLLSYAFPEATNKQPYLFSTIEEAVLQEEVELGVLIHENRFTYAERGLHRVADLGEIWEEKMNLPIPLGGIFIKRSLGEELALKMEALIRSSLQYSIDRWPRISEYVQCHAQAMSEDVMRQHIQLYVNHFSMNLGEEGKNAVDGLEKIYRHAARTPGSPG